MTDSRRYPNRPYLAVSAAIVRDGKVLVVRRARTPALNLYTLPGGGVEIGETLHEAVMREVREETGLDPVGLRDAGITRRFQILPEWRARYAPEVAENIEYLWYLELPDRQAVKIDPDEHRAYRWLPLDFAIEAAASWTNREGLERLGGAQKKS